MEAFLGLVGGGLIGWAIVGPQFLRMRRRSLGRILRRELTEDGASYLVRVRKKESVWTPGASQRTWGPGNATYVRDDLPDGVVYRLEFVPENGAVAHYSGPVPPAYADGGEARALLRRIKRTALLVFSGVMLMRFGCVAIGILFGYAMSGWFDLPTWAAFLLACAGFAICDYCLDKGLLVVAKGIDRRHARGIKDEV